MFWPLLRVLGRLLGWVAWFLATERVIRGAGVLSGSLTDWCIMEKIRVGYGEVGGRQSSTVYWENMGMGRGRGLCLRIKYIVGGHDIAYHCFPHSGWPRLRVATIASRASGGNNIAHCAHFSRGRAKRTSRARQARPPMCAIGHTSLTVRGQQ